MVEEKLPSNNYSPVWLRKHAKNTKGRDYIVGDIHGCLDELISLLAQARFNPKRDRLFSVGDLVDRGPKSAQVLELLDKPWFHPVRGNHEQMLIEHWRNPTANPAYDPSWLPDIPPDSVPYYTTQLESLPHVIKIGTAPDAIYIMHAELWEQQSLIDDATIDEFKFPDTRQTFAKVLWSRHVIGTHWKDPNKRYQAESMSRIFCGHTIVQLPTAVENSIYMDTGAFAPYIDPINNHAEHFGLTLVEANSMRHWFAPTCMHYRGTVVDMGRIDETADMQNMVANEMQPETPSST